MGSSFLQMVNLAESRDVNGLTREKVHADWSMGSHGWAWKRHHKFSLQAAGSTQNWQPTSQALGYPWLEGTPFPCNKMKLSILQVKISSTF